MKLTSRILTVATQGPGLYEFTPEARSFVAGTGAGEAQLTLFCRHTSASLTIQENADPDVRADLRDAMGRLAPHDPRLYRHGMEGPDDMPAHIRAVLTDVSLTIPVLAGRLALGTWQGVYLWEHRDQGSHRQIAMQLLYEAHS